MMEDQDKRSVKSSNEVRESMTGHRKFAATLQKETPAYIGQRHVSRLCADAYGKGTTRSNEASTNLRTAGTEDVVTSAESFHSASLVQFPGRDVTAWREAM